MVPRTFLGPVVLAALAKPIQTVLSFIEDEMAERALMQLVVRVLLGGLVCMAVARLALSVRRTMGATAMRTMLLGVCCTFHFCFYASRPLPNTFATVLMTYAASIHLDTRGARGAGWTGEWVVQLGCLVAAAGLFRCDMIMLAVPMLLVQLLRGRVQLVPLIAWGLVLSALLVGLSVAVDSLFWRRLLWPEGEVFFFNAILDKSS